MEVGQQDAPGQDELDKARLGKDKGRSGRDGCTANYDLGLLNCPEERIQTFWSQTKSKPPCELTNWHSDLSAYFTFLEVKQVLITCE